MTWLRALGPAMPRGKASDSLRAAIGAALGLAASAGLLWAITPNAHDPMGQPLLIAPFGASALLVFSVPNSPLAQPWSVVIGNTLSAIAALVALRFGLPHLATASLAVLLAILAMATARALHPPGGAVALLTAMTAPEAFPYLLSPVFVGSLAIVACAVLWNRATGRVYPFRQSPPPLHATTDPPPERRTLPSPDALADLLARLRLDTNIGVEDLTRLITAAEAEAASRPLAGLTAAHLMSRGLITVSPDTALDQLAETFRSHRFKSLPVADQGRYIGLVPQAALLTQPDSQPDWLSDSRQTDLALTAKDLMQPAQTATPSDPAAHLVQMLADGQQQAVPIVDQGQLQGLVTRSDLIALLSRSIIDLQAPRTA